MMKLEMDRAALGEFMRVAFPQVAEDFAVEDVEAGRISVRLKVGERNLRPGGTVSGPAMFSLADVSVYLALLAVIGPQALAVTTSASLDFLRKPEAGRDLISDCRLLKVGKVLAVGEVLIRSEGKEEPVARASLTYSIPPKRGD